MMRVLIAMLAALIIIYIVPFIVYALFSAFAGLKPPEGVSPGRLLLSFLVMKVGTAIGFVLIFYLARQQISGHWLLYAAIWLAMSVLHEIGQALGPTYSWKEAIAGIISEVVYFPAAAFATNWLIGLRPTEP